MRTCVTCRQFAFLALQSPHPDEEAMDARCLLGRWILTTMYEMIIDASTNNARGVVGVKAFRRAMRVAETCDDYEEEEAEAEREPEGWTRAKVTGELDVFRDEE